MVLKSKAKAIAELDAICDEFELTYRRDGIDPGNDRHVEIDDWVARVSAEWRPWLRDELSALQKEFAAEAENSSVEQIPEGVCVESWNAVGLCESLGTLSHELRLALCERVEPREFDAGEALLVFGKPASGLFLIVDGEVQVVGHQGSDQHEIDTDGVGSVLGEMSVLTGYPCSADVIAKTRVRTLMLPLSAIEHLRGESLELEIALSQLVSDRLGRIGRDALCGKSLGGFAINRCIGRGAMGVVYEAVDEVSGAPVALKMMRHGFIHSPQVVARFEQESDLLQQLTHPNIVSFRGHFTAYRTRFIVLDLYDGMDLRRVIGSHGPMDESTVRGALGQIAAGLEFAHQQGVLHLDLKPANVLIDRLGNIAITDFGLSRLVKSGGYDEECVGTPLYMPLEQFMMADIGPHCDWYAFGCIAYELIAGERLFRSDHSPGFVDDKFRSPSSQWPVVKAETVLGDIIRSALQPQVDRRHVDLAEIAKWARPVPEIAIETGSGEHQL